MFVPENPVGMGQFLVGIPPIGENDVLMLSKPAIAATVEVRKIVIGLRLFLAKGGLKFNPVGIEGDKDQASSGGYQKCNGKDKIKWNNK